MGNELLWFLVGLFLGIPLGWILANSLPAQRARRKITNLVRNSEGYIVGIEEIISD